MSLAREALEGAGRILSQTRSTAPPVSTTIAIFSLLCKFRETLDKGGKLDSNGFMSASDTGLILRRYEVSSATKMNIFPIWEYLFVIANRNPMSNINIKLEGGKRRNKMTLVIIKVFIGSSCVLCDNTARDSSKKI